MKKRFLLKTTAALLAACSFGMANAQNTPLKFQLDWRFEGPSAFFLTPAAKGYFKDAKLDVTVDAGNGSGGAVTRVASGSYDIGFADLAALMEFHANNPDAPNKPVAVMMVYNNTPASVMALKKSGIKTPADLNGKKLGAPVFDAGRRAFPIFAKANNVTGVAWTAMDPPLRETMLVRGDVDAITGFTFTSLLNLEARGVKAEDVVVLPYPDFGVKLYGNAIIVSPRMIKDNPAAVKAFGGEYLVRGGRFEVMEGQWQPTRIAMLRFPSFDAAKAFYDDEMYRAARAQRAESGADIHLRVPEGQPPLHFAIATGCHRTVKALLSAGLSSKWSMRSPASRPYALRK